MVPNIHPHFLWLKMVRWILGKIIDSKITQPSHKSKFAVSARQMATSAKVIECTISHSLSNPISYSGRHIATLSLFWLKPYQYQSKAHSRISILVNYTQSQPKHLSTQISFYVASQAGIMFGIEDLSPLIKFKTLETAQIIERSSKLTYIYCHNCQTPVQSDSPVQVSRTRS